MSNVSVDSPLVIFRPTTDNGVDACRDISAEELRARELAERAAAKSSSSVAARRAHQELALLYASRRRSDRQLPD